MIRRVRNAALVAVLAGCGGKAPPPAKPKPPDPKALAAQLDRDMTELGAIAKQHRDDCHALIGELRPLVARMKLHVDEAKKLQSDRKLGTELQQEARKYDDATRTDAIAENLGAAYLGCKRKDCPPPADPTAPPAECRSAAAEELRGVIDQIPTW